ncbi:MAG TPA: amidohydrolase family protein, partial [Burkholderiales bacterium]|nr:amidohydrolase family protein [Burkholderiales bacterium]
AREHPDRYAVMGRISVRALPTAHGALKSWRAQPGMLGVRLAFNNQWAAPLLTEGKVDWLWQEAEACGVPLMVLVWHSQMHFIDAVAQRHPQLRIVLDHFALDSRERDAAAFKDFDQLLAMAKHPNVAAKASALPCYTNDTYPYRSLHPYIKQAYDAFGPQRLFWGTDLSRSPISYRQQVTMFAEEIPWLSDEDKTWIMGRGVCEWLGWR